MLLALAVPRMKEQMKLPTRQRRLVRLQQAYEADPAFEHFRNLGRVYVPGHGSHRPEVVLVGEAPGSNEDKGGVPFIGRAGKMLDELLESIALPREDIYITNVVRYRPKNNNTPTREERDASLPYLLKELDILQPRVVGLMGQVAVSCFFGEVRIGSVHGNTTAYQSPSGVFRHYVALYHPMFGVYQRSNADLLFHDFKRLSETMKMTLDKRDGVF